MKTAFIDLEVSAQGKIMDAGAITSDGRKIHSARIEAVMDAVRGCDCLCESFFVTILTHNALRFDPV